MQVLVSLFVDCLQVFVVESLHVAQGFLQVDDVSVTRAQRVCELLADSRNVGFCRDSELAFVLVLAPKEHVFLGADRLLSFFDQTPQYVELSFKVGVLLLLSVGIVGKHVTLSL